MLLQQRHARIGASGPVRARCGVNRPSLVALGQQQRNIGAAVHRCEIVRPVGVALALPSRRQRGASLKTQATATLPAFPGTARVSTGGPVIVYGAWQGVRSK